MFGSFSTVGLSLLLIVTSWILAGIDGLLIGGVGLAASFIFFRRHNPALTMWLARAFPLNEYELAWLHIEIANLSDRAGLKTVPKLFFQPSIEANAFTTGDKNNAAIAISEGLLEILTPQELVAVIAHEIGHIANNDTMRLVMNEVLRKFISNLALIGLWLNLAFLLLEGQSSHTLLDLFLLALAPLAATMIILRGARRQEYAADAMAVHLVGDRNTFARALIKIHRFNQGWLRQLMISAKAAVLLNLLQTHPPIKKRLEKIGVTFGS